MLLVKGDKSIGALHFPDKKLPHICYCVGNNVYDCGRFNSEESAERFMKALSDLVGIERKDGENDGCV